MTCTEISMLHAESHNIDDYHNQTEDLHFTRNVRSIINSTNVEAVCFLKTNILFHTILRHQKSAAVNK